MMIMTIMLNNKEDEDKDEDEDKEDKNEFVVCLQINKFA